MTHDEIAELAFTTLLICRDRGVTDPLRQAHAIAVAIRQAEADTLATGGYIDAGAMPQLEHPAPYVVPRPGHGDPGTDTKGPRG